MPGGTPRWRNSRETTMTDANTAKWIAVLVFINTLVLGVTAFIEIQGLKQAEQEHYLRTLSELKSIRAKLPSDNPPLSFDKNGPGSL